MHSLYFHIIATAIILPMVVAYPGSKQESDLYSTTDSKGLLLRDLETPVSTKNTLPDSISKRAFWRNPKIGKSCDGTFYSQTRINSVTKKYCQKNAARLRETRILNSNLAPVIPTNIYPELKDNYVKIPISGIISRNRIKSVIYNHGKLADKDYIIITKHDCKPYSMIRFRAKKYWVKCVDFPQK
ncbi:hypothetical protein GcC1_043028 [Golovinomyces cichoracearum]|uniref:Secreted effector protein n=1 Tax=Golovinomyces cichoracearum TaxID=62708 RepID=A0A420IYZ0_9PEZI|nr:hypothetical protein GcC1_043028 [Golovinomyces cichoracearum]